MSNPIVRIPYGLDLDTDLDKVSADKAVFMKNMTYEVNRNSAVGGSDGYNFGALTPIQGNLIIYNNEFIFPAGDNYCVGMYHSEETNELYVFVFNSQSNHFIYRVNGSDGSLQLIYQNPCLNFQLDPKHFISEGRCTLVVVKNDDVAGKLRSGKYLAFTENFNDQRWISTEDSRVTLSYVGANPAQEDYFARGNCDPCYLINLGVATPLTCVGIEEVPRDDPAYNASDIYEQNLLINISWQFRYKYIDVFGRESEHSIISTPYFSLSGGVCVNTAEQLARCIKLIVDAGCPLVDKIELEFRKCSGNSIALTTFSDWYKFDTIEKYINCDDPLWFERDINNQWQQIYDERIAGGDSPEQAAQAAKYYTKYDAGNNTFEYIFCNTKECEAVPFDETNRTQNDLPLRSSGLVSVGSEIALTNNERGFNPIDCAQLENINFNYIPPNAGSCDTNESRDIIIYVPIINDHNGSPGFTFAIFDGNNANAEYVAFGGINNNDVNKVYEWHFESHQYFPNKGQKGWVGYLAGTAYRAMSFQVLLELATGAEVGIDVLPPLLYTPPAGFIIVQKFEFKNVVPGKYVFRIASQENDFTAGYDKTSTQVWGQCILNNPIAQTTTSKELLIDCCTASVTIAPTDTTICIMSFSSEIPSGNPAAPYIFRTIVDGYAKEDKISGIPIEQADVNMTAVSPLITYTTKTDHNGYFFGATLALVIFVNVTVDRCDTTISQPIIAPGAPGTLLCKKTTQTLYFSDNGGITPYPEDGRRIISGRIKLCDFDAGIAGVTLVMLQGAYAKTDSRGYFEIIAHQRDGTFATDGDMIIISQSGGCQLVECDSECDYCFDNYAVPYKDCTEPDRNTTLADKEANIRGINRFGLQSGGRYQLGIIAHDWMGRTTFVQRMPQHFVDIQSIAQAMTFDYGSVQYVIDGSVVFPDWVKKITFCITKNLKWDDFIMWAVDKVEFIDESGLINTITPTKIRLYYESLLEYNKQNNFATNTIWDFAETNTAEKTSVVGDRVEFIVNGDGNWFPISVTALVRYDVAGTYFDIDYTQDLKDLKEGALVRLIRPKTCTTQDVYYELCPSVNVIDGVPESLTGTLPAFDSYLINRQIPIPTYEKDSNGDLKKTVIGKYYNFFFEHPSPSDFFGDHCANRGRIFVVNTFEKKNRFGSEVALSKPLIRRSSFNGLSYFDIADAKTFDEQQWGNIVVILPEQSSILAICEHDNFVVGFRDNNIVVSPDGTVVAPGSGSNWGTPQRKIGQNFGCQFYDINTIRKRDGIVGFVDRNKFAVVMHNYSDAADITVNGFKGYFFNKISYQNGIIRTDATIIPYLHAGINPKSNEYMLTNISIPKPGETLEVSYVNIERGPVKEVNETFCIDMQRGVLKSFMAFTPEYYGLLEGFEKNMVSFREGRSWKHSGNNPDFANFYGIQSKKIITVVYNDFPDKVKKFLYNEVFCNQHRFIVSDDGIVTDALQTSRILAANWVQVDKFWCSDFKCATNTFMDPNLPILAGREILEGDTLYGKFAIVRYESQDVDDNKYCELRKLIAYVIGSGKGGI